MLATQPAAKAAAATISAVRSMIFIKPPEDHRDALPTFSTMEADPNTQVTLRGSTAICASICHDARKLQIVFNLAFFLATHDVLRLPAFAFQNHHPRFFVNDFLCKTLA
jgi:hypothetical protein